MYQTSLNDNPQMDVQGIQRIYRQKQTQKIVYLYRIMVDCFVEKLVLQRQVEKAGGWHQRTYNPANARKLLGIPAHWDDNEQTVDGGSAAAEQAAEDGDD